MADEVVLSPAQLHNMDGNFSAKRFDGSGSADPWAFQSNYFIPTADIEHFRNDAHKDPENGPTAKAVTCLSNWSAVKAAKEDKIRVFEQTGIFVLVCWNGFVEYIAEMRHSSELYVIITLLVS